MRVRTPLQERPSIMAQPPTSIKALRAYDPSVMSAAYRAMVERIWTLRTVFGGTETLMKAGEKMLPKYEKESPDDYRVRASSARLRRNMFRQAVERITGRIFEVPVKLNDPTPAGEVFADDADQRGNSLDRLSRTLYHEALKLGMMHALVDYPVVQAKNLAEERALNARPYLVMLAPDQVIRCFRDKNGTVIHLAWKTSTSVWDEAAGKETCEERIEERFPGRARTWIKGTNGWQLEGKERTITQQKIMFHTLYAEREDDMVARTPLTEVADLTIEHYQLASDYRNCLKHVLFPILTATGVDQKEVGQIVLGPKSILGSANKDAKFQYLEHNGKAIEAGYKDLESLEQRAEAYAGRLTKPTGDVKATTEAISSSEVSSFAKDMATALQDTLQAILDDAALWAGVDSLGRAEVNMDFAVDLPDNDLTVLQTSRSAGDITRETMWKELTRRNVLSRDFDPDAETQALQEQEAEAMDREQEAMKFAASLQPDKGVQRPPKGAPQ